MIKYMNSMLYSSEYVYPEEYLESGPNILNLVLQVYILYQISCIIVSV